MGDHIYVGDHPITHLLNVSDHINVGDLMNVRDQISVGADHFCHPQIDMEVRLNCY